MTINEIMLTILASTWSGVAIGIIISYLFIKRGRKGPKGDMGSPGPHGLMGEQGKCNCNCQGSEPAGQTAHNMKKPQFPDSLTFYHNNEIHLITYVDDVFIRAIKPITTPNEMDLQAFTTAHKTLSEWANEETNK